MKPSSIGLLGILGILAVGCTLPFEEVEALDIHFGPQKAPRRSCDTLTEAEMRRAAEAAEAALGMVDLRLAEAWSDTAAFAVFAGAAARGLAWAAGPAVKSVTTHWGEGTGGSDRVQIEFDAGALRDTWVRVTVAANERTGLSAPDVFYFGHLAGAVAGAGSPADLAVDARDLAAIRRRAASPPAGRAPLADPFDVNRDGTVDLFDVAVTRSNQRHTLSAFTAPAAPAPPAAAAARSPFAAPTRRTPTRRPADYLLAPPP